MTLHIVAYILLNVTQLPYSLFISIEVLIVFTSRLNRLDFFLIIVSVSGLPYTSLQTTVKLHVCSLLLQTGLFDVVVREMPGQRSKVTTMWEYFYVESAV